MAATLKHPPHPLLLPRDLCFWGVWQRWIIFPAEPPGDIWGHFWSWKECYVVITCGCCGARAEAEHYSYYEPGFIAAAAQWLWTVHQRVLQIKAHAKADLAWHKIDCLMNRKQCCLEILLDWFGFWMDNGWRQLLSSHSSCEKKRL